VSISSKNRPQVLAKGTAVIQISRDLPHMGDDTDKELHYSRGQYKFRLTFLQTIEVDMKKLLFAAMICMASSAHATIYDMDDFVWTDDTGFGSGEISRSGSNTATIRGSDDGSGFFDPTQMTSTSTLGLGSGVGDVMFNWDYTTGDTDSLFDPFVWLYAADGDINNLTITNITTNGITNQNGFWTFAVAAGSLFGLSIDTADNQFGNGEFGFVTISQFAFDDGFGAVTPMPVPPAFLLFGTALAGLGFFRKKKAAA
jgi:hypothetical protein